MKTRTFLTQHIELGNDLKLEVQRNEGDAPAWVDITFLDKDGDPIKVAIPSEQLERSALAIAKLRQSCPEHWDEEVCPDHGYYERQKGVFGCPTCEAERADRKAIDAVVAT